MRWIPPFLFLALACAAPRTPPFVPAAECATDAGIKFELQTARACEFYGYVGFLVTVELGGPEVDREDWIPPFPRATVDATLAGLTVYVHDGIQFDCEGGGEGLVGCQWWSNPAPVIEVGETGGAALHEAFHLYQERTGVAYESSYNHVGWADAGWEAENGLVYWFLDSQFHARFGGASPTLDGGISLVALPPGFPEFREATP